MNHQFQQSKSKCATPFINLNRFFRRRVTYIQSLPKAPKQDEERSLGAFPNSKSTPTNHISKVEPIGIMSYYRCKLRQFIDRIEGILNKQTPDKFDLLKDQLIDSRITSPRVLMEVVSLIFDKAVLEPTFCPMYAQLCSDLNQKLPEFPSDEPDGAGQKITFKRMLLNFCQMTFEGGDSLSEEVMQMTAGKRRVKRLLKLRFLGNIRLIGELLKQNMVTFRIAYKIIEVLFGPDNKTFPAEENVEAICVFLNTIGKLLDNSHPKAPTMNDMYFDRLKELIAHSQLTPRLKIMVRDLIDLRSNNWGEEAKAKTSNEIHSEILVGSFVIKLGV